MKHVLNCGVIDRSICDAADHYAKSAPTVADWLEDLCQRLSRKHGQDSIQLVEVAMLDALYEDGQWMHPNHAANAVYHMLERLGRDTTGQAGF